MTHFDCIQGGESCTISKWIVFSLPVVIFVLLVTILILSVCLCRVCKRAKKQNVTEDVAADNLDEATLHYAELQCLPGPNRGQCDGGPCPAFAAAQNTDYATVAELKGPEDDCCTQEQKEDAFEAIIENESLMKED